MNAFIRAFFRERGVLEVETPYLSQSGNSDPMIESAQVSLNQELRYLHTSPEYPMKRLLAAGSGDIYQICKVWRAESLGSRHNPEFTMLEWYRVGFCLLDLMDEAERLLLGLLPHLSSHSHYKTYADCFVEKLAIDPHIACRDDVIACIKKQAISLADGWEEWDKQAMLDLLMTHCIEPNFPVDRLTFVYDYPSSQRALACIKPYKQVDSFIEKVFVAERFEVYCGDLELANAYQELTDAKANHQVVLDELAIRQQQGQHVVKMDVHFLAAMKTMPKASGIAVGLDRVLMVMMHKNKLQSLISFDWAIA